MTPGLLVYFCVLCVLFAALTAAIVSPQRVFAPRKAGSGDFVAEVWLEWPLCRGSTLYRQRFARQEQAALFAKFYAMLLDWMLPTHWRTTDYLGRPSLERYDYGIHFGVRAATSEEAQSFTPVWTTRLPGHAGHAGEHAQAHPLANRLDDYKI